VLTDSNATVAQRFYRVGSLKCLRLRYERFPTMKLPTVAFACLCTIVVGCGKILYGEEHICEGYSSRKFNQIRKGIPPLKFGVLGRR